MFSSRRTITLALVVGMLAALIRQPIAVGQANQPADGAKQEAFTELLRKLEKDIAAARGLEFKTPVVAKIIPRAADAAKRVQGYYAIQDKTLYVYDDIAGNYERGVLIHEMVHALQDQHFGLAKLHQTSFGGEAELALAALIEGDATFTMMEVLKKDQPRVVAMLDAPLDKARDVQNSFIYAQGARYVKSLKDRGGWPSVNFAYKNPPRTTAAVLHPEGVKTIVLGSGPAHGELGIIKMFLSQKESAPLAVQAAAGWKGDQSSSDDNGNLWTVAFTPPEAPARFQEAMSKFRAAQHANLRTITGAAGERLWQDAEGHCYGAILRGDRVHVLEAPDEAHFRKLRARLDEPPVLSIYSSKEKRAVSFGQMMDALSNADIVCIGETHDSEPCHRVQLQVIKALFAQDERLGVGMEMFQRPFQKEIDRYFKGETGEADFLKAAEYEKRWGFDWQLYRPIVEFCRKNGVPLAALNAPRELTGRLSKVGYAALTDDEKTQLGTIDFQVPAHRAYWFDRITKLHGDKGATEEQKERSYQIMTTWDEYMGASAADFQQARNLRRMVVLAGSGHVDHGFGIPNRAAKRTGGAAATIHIDTGITLEKAAAEPAADFIVIVK